MAEYSETVQEQAAPQKQKAPASKSAPEFTHVGAWMEKNFPFSGTTQRTAFKVFYAKTREAYSNDYDAIFKAWMTTGALAPEKKAEAK